MTKAPSPAGDWIPYATFGQRFFEYAVTQDRILGALDGLAGHEIEVRAHRCRPWQAREGKRRGDHRPGIC